MNYQGFNPYYPQQNELLMRRESEHRELRSLGAIFGVCLFVYVAIQYAVAFGAGLFVGELYFSSELFKNSIVGITSVLSLVLPFGALSLKKGRRSYFKALPFNPPEKKLLAVFAVLACFFGCIATNYAVMYFETFLSSFGVDLAQEPYSSAEVSPFAAVMLIFNTALTPAIVEEFAFRGVMMQSLRRFGDGFAIVATALIFALCHGSLLQIPFAFVVGIMLGYAVTVTDSLWTGVAIHFLNNAFAATFSVIYTVYPDLSNTPYAVALSAISVLGLAGLAGMLAIPKRRLLRGDTLLRRGEKAKTLFSSPALIVMLVIMTALSILNSGLGG